MVRARKRSQATSSGLDIIARVLTAAEPRPQDSDGRDERNKYAIRFADEMAKCLAESLADRLPGIRASAERDASAAAGKKQLDVNFSTAQLGLGLGISLKSVHLRDSGSGKRYTHNVKRNEEELRIEATGYHKRQPYAVMVGVIFLPFDSCDDAKRNNPSSFGSWVRHLRPYAGRSGPRDDEDRFERIYIALYEPNGSKLNFFDIEADPPKSGRPSTNGPPTDPDGRYRRLLSYEEFLNAIYHHYLRRNNAEFRWADAGEQPLAASEIATVDDDDEENES